MEKNLEIESIKLAGCWQKYGRDYLQNYLVQSVQDPRINLQSILTRHYLIDKLFPGQFDFFMEHEIRFSLVVNWLIRLWKDGLKQYEQVGILDALFENQPYSQNIQVPEYILESFSMLEPHNYICSLLSARQREDSDIPLQDYDLNTFQNIWKEILSESESAEISVIEPACGSANDSRFFKSYNILQFINYHGFDISEKNIINSSQIFDGSMFSVGNAIEICRDDKSFDYCFVHDLFEHLSLEAMKKAISEICRVTKKGICANFFNMADIDEHRIIPSGDYNWNELSRKKTAAEFLKYAKDVETLSIGDFLVEQFNCSDNHNKGAFTMYIKL